MARIAGIDLPKDKRIEIGLTYIYGIGRKHRHLRRLPATGLPQRPVLSMISVTWAKPI
mgnify:CR=1 FL=1